MTNQAASDAEKLLEKIWRILPDSGAMQSDYLKVITDALTAAIAEKEADKKATVRSIAIALGMRAWNPEDVPVYAAQVVSERDAALAELKRAREERDEAVSGENGYYEALADTAEALGLIDWAAEEVAPKAKALAAEVERLKENVKRAHEMWAETDTSIRLILARHGITHDESEPEATLHVVDGVETLSTEVERLKGELSEKTRKRQLRDADRIKDWANSSREELLAYAAECERRKNELDFEWQDEFETLEKENAALKEQVEKMQPIESSHARWLAWSDGRYPEDTIGDVIAAWKDGTVMLDDSLEIWNPLRALEFVAKGGELQADAAREGR